MNIFLQGVNTQAAYFTINKKDTMIFENFISLNYENTDNQYSRYIRL